MLIIFLMVYFLFLLSKFNFAIMSARSLVLLSYNAQRAYREAYDINLVIIFLQLLHQFPIFLFLSSKLLLILDSFPTVSS